jgi:hypothetical protein
MPDLLLAWALGAPDISTYLYPFPSIDRSLKGGSLGKTYND